MTAPAASRAGRNLPMAIAVGLGLGVVIVACLLLLRQLFVVIIIAAVVASIWEMRSTLAKARGITLAWIPMAVGAAATIAFAWWYGHDAQVVGIALTALAVMAWRFAKGAEGYLGDVSASVFLGVYLGLFASFATLLVAPHDGHARVLAFLIMVVASDTGGYAAGALLGRHPMAPTISPKKSWEGFGGSVVAAMAGGALSVSLMPALHHPWWQGLIVGGVLALVATMGDLAESLIKRDLGVKDMGTLLPGHGGVMDRMDSLLPSAVVAWVLLTLFIPV
ncbi:phosphatidate cytidylyltransferase [Nakamurella panacisegetis]|uniref:Phosphatidate cytidylyltransferase n=1 Tax=Nakamurella panacisegetis TaxID=1090615 RepID=A0A1H0RLJ6_9ACTN|nr:phosphatidate cytidylyltransferase [Nakamurella panacisegetis]SDP30347.1 phosphatidate cytidylyltransferase [Nakamurella panacisegetis]